MFLANDRVEDRTELKKRRIPWFCWWDKQVLSLQNHQRQNPWHISNANDLVPYLKTESLPLMQRNISTFAANA